MWHILPGKGLWQAEIESLCGWKKCIVIVKGVIMSDKINKEIGMFVCGLEMTNFL